MSANPPKQPRPAQQTDPKARAAAERFFDARTPAPGTILVRGRTVVVERKARSST